METKEVKQIIENFLGGSSSHDRVIHLLSEMQKPDCDSEAKHQKVIELWTYLKQTPVIPDNLNSDEDMQLCQVLADFSENCDEPEALSVAFVLISHRLTLGDPLEKAFISQLAMSILIENRKKVLLLLNHFIKSSEDISLYRETLEDDEDCYTLYKEMIRAIGIYLLWMKQYYPDYNPFGMTGDIEGLMNQLNKESENKKPAMPKFLAVCRFYYEEFYRNN